MAKVTPHKKGSAITWNWLGKKIAGQVVEIYLEPITKEIKGKKIKRNGSPEKPAYLVLSEAGNYALKLHSEIEVQDGKAKSKSSPKMFK